MNTIKVLVCGDRNWKDKEAIRRELSKLPQNTTIIHGDARGADKIAGVVGHELGFGIIAVPAEWEKYGLRAGPIRNRHMFDTHNPDIVFAFHPDLTQSKGTRDMISYATKKKCPYKLFNR